MGRSFLALFFIFIICVGFTFTVGDVVLSKGWNLSLYVFVGFGCVGGNMWQILRKPGFCMRLWLQKWWHLVKPATRFMFVILLYRGGYPLQFQVISELLVVVVGDCEPGRPSKKPCLEESPCREEFTWKTRYVHEEPRLTYVYVLRILLLCWGI